jgi:hypothetical protein
MTKSGSKPLLCLAALLATLLCLPASGQTTLLRLDYPEAYTVQEGDTLWAIAGQFLTDPARWPEVWQPDPYLDNSELIYPGDTLSINFVGGSPRIAVQRGNREVVDLGPQVRAEPLSSSIPAIPLEAIESSFTRNRIVSQQEYEAAPYIVAILGDNLAIGTGDEIYARGNWPPWATTFEIYTLGRTYGERRDDVEQGLEMEYLGFATITAEEGPELRRLMINNSGREIRVGNRLLLREQSRIDSTIFPTEPVNQVSGEIIAFLGNEALASQLDTVVINLGEEDELVVGDVLVVQQAGTRIVDDVERERMGFGERMRTLFNRASLDLPGNEVGTILVYKTFDDFSYAVVLSSTEPLQLANQVSNP